MSLSYIDAYIKALLEEIRLKRDLAEEQQITSIYYGGGTPSVLSSKQISLINEQIHKYFKVSPDAEITIETNPDDLTNNYLESLRELSFNRLSIGVQSFHEHELNIMRRSHTSVQAREAIENAANKGFNNINMDLIYGLPYQNLDLWEKNLLATMELPIQHLSAYHLTYEPGTVFFHWRKKGRIEEIEEDLSVQQFLMLREITGRNGFEHYEISNFAREHFRSRHNQLYWSGEGYIGFGPSAHSYLGETRQWNVSSIKKYTHAITSGETYYEKEILNQQERFHDYLLTRLRMKEGIVKQQVNELFGKEIFHHFENSVEPFLASGDLIASEERINMTEKGWLKSDMIIQSMMLP